MREKKSLKKSLLTGVAMGCKENFADQCGQACMWWD